MLEGPTLVEEAVRSGVEVLEVFVDEESRTRWGWLDLVPAERVRSVRAGVLGRILDPVHPRPVAAVVARPDITLDAVLDGGLESSAPVLVLVLAGVADPGNLGTLIRSGAAAGATGVVVTEASADPFGPKAVRASAGAVLHLPVVEASLTGAVDALLTRGIELVVTRADDGVPLDSADLRGATALVLGNEAHGVPETVDARGGIAVRIPMAPGSESLNVAMAGTVVLFEAARQRRSAGADGGGEVDGRDAGPSA